MKLISSHLEHWTREPSARIWKPGN